MKLPQSRIASLLVVATFVIGCAEPELRPRFGDLVPERVFGPRSLQAEFTRRGEHLVSPLLEAPDGATRVAFLVDVQPSHKGAALHLEARGYDASGRATAWRPAAFTWSEDLIRVAKVELGRAAWAVEVRLPDDEVEALAGLTYSAVVPMAEGRQDPAFDAYASRPLVDVGAPAAATQGLLAGVQPRSAWGARASQCTSLNETKTRISIHHTVTPSTGAPDYPARLRGIQAYHMDGRGWCDVGYHVLMTADGTAWEAREARYLGAHVGSHNTNNLGISMVGCFHPSADCDAFPPQTPPEALIDGVAAVVATAAAHYGIAISPSTVMGHRDNPDQTTSCPGDNAHARLDDIRARAGGGAATPPPASTTGRVQGVVWDLSVTADASQSATAGARLPGAEVRCDCGEVTYARAEDAYWSLDLLPGSYTFTAIVDGYAQASRQLQVTSGGSHWASIGVSPAAQAARLTVAVLDDDSGAPVEGALVEATGTDPSSTAASGEVELSLTAGNVTVRASAEGYEPAETARELAAGAEERLVLRLAPMTVSPEPGEGEGRPGEVDPGEEGGTEPVGEEPRLGPERVHIPPSSPAVVCRCVAGDSDATDPMLSFVVVGALAALAAGSRRRR